jgi:hypothetical protein
VKYANHEVKYKTKRIRRLVIIDEKSQKFDDKINVKHKFIMETVKDFKDFDKVHYLTDGIEHFYEKYPFLCLDCSTNILPKPETLIIQSKEEETKDEIVEKAQKAGISDAELKFLYSFSKFPTELIPDKVFIGSIHNSNNKKQLADLKIKSLLDLVTYPEKQQPEAFKTTNFTYRNIPMDGDFLNYIDLDEICQAIDILLESNQGPLLIYDKDGDSYAPGIAIAYQMWTKKQKIDMASLVVFQKKSSVNVNKNLYSMLQVWNPIKK